TSPSRAAPSSVATRPRSTSAFSSASISTARPSRKRTRRPVTSAPATSSGFVAATTPSDRKSTRLNSSHLGNSYAVFCLKKKNQKYLQHYIKLFPVYSTFKNIEFLLNLFLSFL